MSETPKTVLGGPMFEPAVTEYWEGANCMSCRTRRQGGHYNHFWCHGDAMAALRGMFPEGKANELNFVLFSTSGVHGMYTTIEEAEAQIGTVDEDGEPNEPQVTFLIVHPRLVTFRYGNCEPRTPEDFAFLKALRASSWAAVQSIGRPE